MEPQIEKFFTETHRRSYNEGEAKGKAEGKAEALAKILTRRGLTITDEQQHQIATCTGLNILDHWLDTALSVTSVNELLTESLTKR